MSYTRFAFSDAAAEMGEDMLTASVTVRNTGERTGTEVVQMYVGYPESKVDRPVKQLRGFARVTLQPGESKRVRLSCPKEKLKYYEPSTRTWIFEDGSMRIFLGSSSADEDLLTVNL